MELVSEFLPNGHSLWKAVAAEYQRRSGESEERDPRDMEKYWRFKMCNNYKKPTGGGGPKYECATSHESDNNVVIEIY